MGLILSIIFGTVLVLSMLSKPFANLEKYLIDRFSHATATRRWFTVWVLVYVVWVIIHINFMGVWPWYTPDVDLVILTGLFSAVPFWVENSLKRGQSQFNDLLISLVENNVSTLDKLILLTQSVQQAQERAEAEEEALFVLVEKLVNSLEVKDLHGQQMESPDSQNKGDVNKND